MGQDVSSGPGRVASTPQPPSPQPRGYAERFSRNQRIVGTTVALLYATGYLAAWVPVLRGVVTRGATLVVILAVLALMSPALLDAFRPFLTRARGLAVTTALLTVGLFATTVAWGVVSSGLPAPAHDNTANFIQEVHHSTPVGVVVVVLAGAVLGPVFEELLYRGVLFRVLHGLGAPVAHLGTAFLFGLQHVVGPVFVQHDPAAWSTIGSYILFSLVLTCAYTRTRTLAPGILAHVIFNSVGLLTVVT